MILLKNKDRPFNNGSVTVNCADLKLNVILPVNLQSLFYSQFDGVTYSHKSQNSSHNLVFFVVGCSWRWSETTCKRKCRSSSSLVSVLLYSWISATPLSVVSLTTLSVDKRRFALLNPSFDAQITGSVVRKSDGKLRQRNRFTELLVTNWSRVNVWKFFRSTSDRFGGLFAPFFCIAATISFFVEEKTWSSNRDKPTSSCDRYQRWEDSFLAVTVEIAWWMVE